jgi:hypothetical protein
MAMFMQPRIGGVFIARTFEVIPQLGDTIHFYNKAADFE